jgi:hypothetical protein
MIFLGAYWTAAIYDNWQNKPVVTTATTTAYPITDIEFPSVTICAQGLVTFTSNTFAIYFLICLQPSSLYVLDFNKSCELKEEM